jgi:hypothetical protein
MSTNYIYGFGSWQQLFQLTENLQRFQTEIRQDKFVDSESDRSFLSSCFSDDCISFRFIRGPFAKFAYSPYYSESELCGGAVTVSFSKYLPRQAMHFLQRSTHFSETCCRPLISPKFLALELPFHVWKSPEIAWGEV